VVREDLSELRFRLESANPDAHPNGMRVAGLPDGTWRVLSAERLVATFDVVEGGAARVEVPVGGVAGSAVIRIERV
jgi:hypothetical protein